MACLRGNKSMSQIYNTGGASWGKGSHDMDKTMEYMVLGEKNKSTKGFDGTTRVHLTVGLYMRSHGPTTWSGFKLHQPSTTPESRPYSLSKAVRVYATSSDATPLHRRNAHNVFLKFQNNLKTPFLRLFILFSLSLAPVVTRRWRAHVFRYKNRLDRQWWYTCSMWIPHQGYSHEEYDA